MWLYFVYTLTDDASNPGTDSISDLRSTSVSPFDTSQHSLQSPAQNSQSFTKVSDRHNSTGNLDGTLFEDNSEGNVGMIGECLNLTCMKVSNTCDRYLDTT